MPCLCKFPKKATSVLQLCHRTLVQEEPAFWCGGSLQMCREAGGGENELAFEDHCHKASVCRLCSFGGLVMRRD